MKFMRLVVCLGLFALGACAADIDSPPAPEPLDPTGAVDGKAVGRRAPGWECWVDDNGIESCCSGNRCCSYIDQKWWCG